MTSAAVAAAAILLAVAGGEDSRLALLSLSWRLSPGRVYMCLPSSFLVCVLGHVCVRCTHG